MKKKTIIIVTTLVVLLGVMALTLASNKKVIDRNKEVKNTETNIAVTLVSTEMK